MQSIYKNVNKIQTNLLVWSNPFDCNGTDVLIIITGNPGIPDFYIEFGSELHRSTNLPVCIVGQAGHAAVPDKDSNVLKNKEHLFNLEGQLGHKLDLLCNIIDQHSKLHLIGHSIGAWEIVELMDKNEFVINRVASVNLLFPTLQKMAVTHAGCYVNGFLRRFHYFVLLFFHMLYLLPEVLKVFLVGLYLRFNYLPLHYTERILKYLNPKVSEKVLFLAYDEMDRVVPLNCIGIDKIKRLTNIIYSTNDSWVPLDYINDLKVFQPELTMKEVDIAHAFVLKSSERVAEMVTQFIKSKL